jgi:hypothetical protein
MTKLLTDLVSIEWAGAVPLAEGLEAAAFSNFQRSLKKLSNGQVPCRWLGQHRLKMKLYQ